MNYEEAGIKMISEFKKKIYQRRFAHKYFDKKRSIAHFDSCVSKWNTCRRSNYNRRNGKN